MDANSIYLYAHILWRIKEGAQVLKPAECQATAGTIKQAAAAKAMDTLAMAVLPDHVHLLLKLQPIQSLHQLVQPLMQETERFIQTIRVDQLEFGWDEAYFAFSISPNTVSKAKDYIGRQADMHQQLSVEAELEKMLAMVAADAH